MITSRISKPVSGFVITMPARSSLTDPIVILNRVTPFAPVDWYNHSFPSFNGMSGLSHGPLGTGVGVNEGVDVGEDDGKDVGVSVAVGGKGVDVSVSAGNGVSIGVGVALRINILPQAVRENIVKSSAITAPISPSLPFDRLYRNIISPFSQDGIHPR